MFHFFQVALQVPAFLYVTPICRQDSLQVVTKVAHWPHNPSQWTGLHSWQSQVSGQLSIPELEPNPDVHPGTDTRACVHPCTDTHTYTRGSKYDCADRISPGREEFRARGFLSPLTQHLMWPKEALIIQWQFSLHLLLPLRLPSFKPQFPQWSSADQLILKFGKQSMD